MRRCWGVIYRRAAVRARSEYGTHMHTHIHIYIHVHIHAYRRVGVRRCGGSARGGWDAEMLGANIKARSVHVSRVPPSTAPYHYNGPRAPKILRYICIHVYMHTFICIYVLSSVHHLREVYVHLCKHVYAYVSMHLFISGGRLLRNVRWRVDVRAHRVLGLRGVCSRGLGLGVVCWVFGWIGADIFLGRFGVNSANGRVKRGV